MATLTIRNLPDGVRDRLRRRAAENGRSMEAEAREALTTLFRETPGRPTEAEYRRSIREIQKAVRRHVPLGVSLVDELIAERREEAARELAEWTVPLRSRSTDAGGNG